MIDKFSNAAMIRGILEKACTGLWLIELEDGKAPRMYVDYTLMNLLGLEGEIDPEECYRHWFERIAEGYTEAVGKAVKKIVATGFAEVEYLWKHPAWDPIFVRCGGVLNRHENGFISLSGYHQNITDIVRLTQEKERLRDSNEELLGSLHNIFFSLYRIDLADWQVVSIRAPEDVGYVGRISYELFIDQYAERLFHPEDYEKLRKDFSKEHVEELQCSGTQQFSREYRRKWGMQYQWISLTLYFCGESGEKRWGILALCDVDERRRKEEEQNRVLREALQAANYANNAKSDFLSRMSHDIRTPINAIMGMTTLAYTRLEDPEQMRECLKKIEDSSRLLLGLVNEVLDMSRIDTGRLQLSEEAFDFRSMVQSCISMVEAAVAEKRQTLLVSLDGLIHTRVIGDEMRIRQILLNLLTNANKYTQEGGTIRLTVTELPSAAGKTAGYQIECEDNGIGIRKEFLPYVFDPFERADDTRIGGIQGHGLGMTIARNLAALMNGRIEVKSEEGKGSCFTAVIYLTLQDEKTGEKKEINGERLLPTELTKLNLKGKRVLVAEDNEINREIITELLKMTGIRTETARNGQEAVELFEQNGKSYDMILMDIMMPVMNGNEAAMAIRRLPGGKDIPIIALTANAFAEDMAASHRAGMDEHLAKPIEPSVLGGLLKHYFGEKSE